MDLLRSPICVGAAALADGAADTGAPPATAAAFTAVFSGVTSEPVATPTGIAPTGRSAPAADEAPETRTQASDGFPPALAKNADDGTGDQAPLPVTRGNGPAPTNRNPHPSKPVDAETPDDRPLAFGTRPDPRMTATTADPVVAAEAAPRRPGAGEGGAAAVPDAQPLLAAGQPMQAAAAATSATIDPSRSPAGTDAGLPLAPLSAARASPSRASRAPAVADRPASVGPAGATDATDTPPASQPPVFGAVPMPTAAIDEDSSASIAFHPVRLGLDAPVTRDPIDTPTADPARSPSAVASGVSTGSGSTLRDRPAIATIAPRPDDVSVSTGTVAASIVGDTASSDRDAVQRVGTRPVPVRRGGLIDVSPPVAGIPNLVAVPVGRDASRAGPVVLPDDTSAASARDVDHRSIAAVDRAAPPTIVGVGDAPVGPATVSPGRSAVPVAAGPIVPRAPTVDRRVGDRARATDAAFDPPIADGDPAGQDPVDAPTGPVVDAVPLARDPVQPAAPLDLLVPSRAAAPESDRSHPARATGRSVAATPGEVERPRAARRGPAEDSMLPAESAGLPPIRAVIAQPIAPVAGKAAPALVTSPPVATVPVAADAPAASGGTALAAPALTALVAAANQQLEARARAAIAAPEAARTSAPASATIEMLTGRLASAPATPATATPGPARTAADATTPIRDVAGNETLGLSLKVATAAAMDTGIVRSTPDGDPSAASAAPADARTASPVAPPPVPAASAAAPVLPSRAPRPRTVERSRIAEALPTPAPAATAPAPAPAPTATAPDLLPTASGTLAAGGADRHVELARHAAWADGIARDIATAGAASGTARFTVAPATLGAVSVAVSRSVEGASVRLVASSEAARDALDGARPQLIAEARAHGLNIRDTQVDLAGSSGGGTGSGGHRDGAPHQPAAVAAPDQPRSTNAVDTNSLTTGAYGGAGGGEAGRQAQQHARHQPPSPQDRTAAARRTSDPDRGTDDARRVADGRYA